MSLTSVPQIDYDRTQKNFVDRLTKRFGMRAVLRNAGGDRWCWMYFAEWRVQQLMGGLIDPLARRVIISPVDLKVPPTNGVNSLVTFVQPYDTDNPVVDEILRIMTAPARKNPAGVVLCWDLQVLK